MVSNVFALGLLALSLWRPAVARWVFGLGCIAASVLNTGNALLGPQMYIDIYGRTSWWVYREIIAGPFAAHVTRYVILVAAGQLVAGALTLRGACYCRLGMLGEMVFLAAIIPLGQARPSRSRS